ncbi:hypothetical protein KW785_01805 [Candidatus Parcubacteria bacterium]|nr:hypothetical protein [Candidatus Parcubacteria bacterium]
MLLVPMLPQVYRFVGNQGEQVHSQPPQSLPDPKFSWGWCKLEQLFDLIKERGFRIHSTNGHGLLGEFGSLYRTGENLPRKRLMMAVVTGDVCMFVPVTKGTKPSAYYLSQIFVPMGWAQMVMTELAERADTHNPHGFRHQRAAQALVGLVTKK